MTTFSALGLSAPILRAVDRQGFTEATDIQSMAIPPLLEGRDLMGLAQTGGGKTAAFLLPLIQRLAGAGQRPAPGLPRAVILAPTRELAGQIGTALRELAKGSPLSHTVVCGGMPFRPQINQLRRGVDILIATPGRLLDHWRRQTVAFDSAGVLVLDEADRMLDMGFIDDVRLVAKAMPADRQTVMFSATMEAAIGRLAQEILQEPVRVEAPGAQGGGSRVADSIDHRVMFLAHHDKPKLLVHLLGTLERDRTLVFARTRASADRLSAELTAAGFAATAIHGDKRQRERDRALKAFRDKKIDVLVATDVAARGIDVAGVSHVINFDLPMEPEAYVHRCGRTGRAGNDGVAISFCGPQDGSLLNAVEKLIGSAVTVDDDQPFHMAPRQAPGPRRAKGRGRPGQRQGQRPGQRQGQRPGKRFGKGKPAADGQAPRRGQGGGQSADRTVAGAKPKGQGKPAFRGKMGDQGGKPVHKGKADQRGKSAGRRDKAA